MYDPSSENKGADQLRVYREADLRFCFRICKTLVFSRSGSYRFASLSTAVSFQPFSSSSGNMPDETKGIEPAGTASQCKCAIHVDTHVHTHCGMNKIHRHPVSLAFV